MSTHVSHELSPFRRRMRSLSLKWSSRLAGWCVLSLGAVATVQPAAAMEEAGDRIALRNVTVVDLEAGRLHPGQTVVWERSRIVAVGADADTPAGPDTRVIEGEGRFLIPGLWDMHVHLLLEPGDESHAERSVLPLYIAHGVTAVRDMSDLYQGDHRQSVVPTKMRWDTEARAGLRVGPRIVGKATFLVNGPDGLSPDFLNAATPAQARKLVRMFADEGSADFIKVYSQIPRDAYFAMMDEARRAGLPVAGHKPLAVSFVEAADAGQRSMEHAREILLDTFPGAEAMQRAGGERNLVPARLREILDAHDPAMLALIFDAMRRNQAYYTPTHLTRRFDWKATEGDPAYLEDPRLAQISPRGRESMRQDVARTRERASQPGDAAIYQAFFEKGLQITGQAQAAGVKLMVGTDAGDSYCFHGSSLHDELGWMVQGGLTPLQALRAATVTPAEYAGRADDFGAIAPGRVADMVLLDRNPLDDIAHTRGIQAVVFNGRLFAREALEALRAEAVSPAP